MKHVTLCAAVVAAASFVTSAAFAGDEAGASKDAKASASTPAKYTAAVDWTMGYGKVNTIEQAFPSSLQTQPTNVAVTAPYRVQSFVLGAHATFDSFGVGARLPLVIGNIRDASPRITGQNVFTNGGLELSLDMNRKLSDASAILPRLAVVLPTAQGTAPDLAAFDKYESFKYTTNMAAAMASGNLEDALYWPGRAAVVPSVGLDWKSGAVHAAPFVKLPVMVDVHSNSDERVRVEAVAGARLAVDATDWVSLGVAAWATVPLAAAAGSRGAVGVASPELRFHSSDDRYALTVGGVLPFAGSLVDPYAGAVRAGVSLGF